MASRDDFYLSNDTGAFQQGLNCAGATSPLMNISGKETHQYDVIVVGAGYAGLTACRELCTASGIGGRTYTAEVDGHLYEMEGTWGLTALLASHTELGVGNNHCTTFFERGGQSVDHKTVLCNVDGKSGREAIPYPHNPHHKPEAKHWEQMSVAQRLEQIESDLTNDDIDKAGLFDVLRWRALSGYTMDGRYETGGQFKIPTGQSTFARCFFEEALQTHDLAYSFNTAVASIQDLADRVIKAAARHGHVNQGAKFHLEVLSSGLQTFCSGSEGGLTSQGNTHIVCFGWNKDFPTPEQDARDFVADCGKLHTMEVRKTVWHNCSKDPFSEGSWCIFPPNFSFEHLEALQERARNILFVGSDRALGWRRYIDSAIERGGLADQDTE
ncbi:hypothetical protein BDV12DRAFT_186001 [Aspergillus spectabilis]